MGAERLRGGTATLERHQRTEATSVDSAQRALETEIAKQVRQAQSSVDAGQEISQGRLTERVRSATSELTRLQTRQKVIGEIAGLMYVPGIGSYGIEGNLPDGTSLSLKMNVPNFGTGAKDIQAPQYSGSRNGEPLDPREAGKLAVRYQPILAARAQRAQR